MNAQEWLNKNEEIEMYSLINYIPLMEKYANYKTRDLEAKILTFRDRLKTTVDVSLGGTIVMKNYNDEYYNIVDIFDEYFNITTNRNDNNNNI